MQHASTVSRSTFYRNFDCLEDVLALLCDRGFQAVFTAYNALPAAQRGNLPKAVFHYWFHNSAVLEALVQIHRTDILFDSLRRSSGLIEALQPLADDPARFDYFVAIITSAMIGVLTVWVEHGKTETEDQMVQKAHERLHRDGDFGAARLRHVKSDFLSPLRRRNSARLFAHNETGPSAKERAGFLFAAFFTARCACRSRRAWRPGPARARR